MQRDHGDSAVIALLSHGEDGTICGTFTLQVQFE